MTNLYKEAEFLREQANEEAKEGNSDRAVVCNGLAAEARSIATSLEKNCWYRAANLYKKIKNL